MQIRLQAFPVVYFNAQCALHKAQVAIHVDGSKLARNDLLVGGSVTSYRCEIGGTTCSEHWVLHVNAGGDVTVSN